MLTRKSVASIMVFVVLAVALAACGPKGPAAVNVTLTEYKVEMSKTSLPAGPVKFTITHEGSIVHEVVVEQSGAMDDPLEANGSVAEVEDLEPGATATLEWTIDTPGEYQLSCHLPGHFENGRITTFTVTAK
ncbi:MAG: cupredoxin domain-containing protein [Chloroflexi bacterium]|nr:cupredoxin domain-containing protein [Chloroflexota bacterium]